MSSTRLPRNEKRQDFYHTPEWVTEALAMYVATNGPTMGKILDVGAGMGGIGLELTSCGFDVEGVEIDPELAAFANEAAGRKWVHCGDFFETEYCHIDTIVMNPPYSQATEFVADALSRPNVKNVFALLRVGFIGSLGRADFHRTFPSDMLVLPKRPSFTADGKCDSCDYAWFHWGPGVEGRVRILDIP